MCTALGKAKKRLLHRAVHASSAHTPALHNQQMPLLFPAPARQEFAEYKLSTRRAAAAEQWSLAGQAQHSPKPCPTAKPCTSVKHTLGLSFRPEPQRLTCSRRFANAATRLIDTSPRIAFTSSERNCGARTPGSRQAKQAGGRGEVSQAGAQSSGRNTGLVACAAFRGRTGKPSTRQ